MKCESKKFCFIFTSDIRLPYLCCRCIFCQSFHCSLVFATFLSLHLFSFNQNTSCIDLRAYYSEWFQLNSLHLFIISKQVHKVFRKKYLTLGIIQLNMMSLGKCLPVSFLVMDQKFCTSKFIYWSQNPQCNRAAYCTFGKNNCD